MSEVESLKDNKKVTSIDKQFLSYSNRTGGECLSSASNKKVLCVI